MSISFYWALGSSKAETISLCGSRSPGEVPNHVSALYSSVFW